MTSGPARAATWMGEAMWMGEAIVALVADGHPISGSVVGTFSRGCYVQFGVTLVAVGDIPAGPIHLCRSLNGGIPSLGASALLSPEVTTIGQVSIGLGTARRWAPTLPQISHLSGALGRLGQLPHHPPGDLTTVWSGVVAAVDAGDLGQAARLLEGRGIGSTPTGDDVLAGLLLIDALVDPSDERRQVRLAIAGFARTTDLSRAFLFWAAHGQSIAPVHDLIDSAVAGEAGAVAGALARVEAIGASSGQAIVAGLGLGARLLATDITVAYGPT